MNDNEQWQHMYERHNTFNNNQLWTSCMDKMAAEQLMMKWTQNMPINGWLKPMWQQCRLNKIFYETNAEQQMNETIINGNTFPVTSYVTLFGWVGQV